MIHSFFHFVKRKKYNNQKFSKKLIFVFIFGKITENLKKQAFNFYKNRSVLLSKKERGNA